MRRWQTGRDPRDRLHWFTLESAVHRSIDSIDSFKTPRPVNWIGGPGGLQPDASQCGLVRS